MMVINLNKKARKRFIIWFCIVVFFLSLISYGIYSIKHISIGTKPPTPVVGIEKPKDYKRFNVLIVGTDDSSKRADTIMLANVDTKQGIIVLTSIPRDTLVIYGGLRHKINSTIVNDGGKLNLLVKSVKEITNVEINYYIRVDFSGFREAIDILDGVEIDVKQDMDYDDPMQNLSIHLKKGKQILDGKSAEKYVRYRSGYAQGDITRMSVQRDFIKELINQKMKPSYITKAPQLVQQLYKYVQTNFILGDLITIADNLDNFKTDSVFKTVELPGIVEDIGDLSYFIADKEEIKKITSVLFSSDG